MGTQIREEFILPAGGSLPEIICELGFAWYIEVHPVNQDWRLQGEGQEELQSLEGAKSLGHVENGSQHWSFMHSLGPGSVLEAHPVLEGLKQSRVCSPKRRP